MKIEFTQSAKEDLKSIEAYIYNDNHVVAKEVVSFLIKKIETVIAQNPSVGRGGRIVGTREFIISKYPYIIPYTVKNNVLYILRILHTSRKW